MRMAHLAARQELRDLFITLKLPSLRRRAAEILTRAC
jgi:transcriptional regulator with AAA-type ATPase domain